MRKIVAALAVLCVILVGAVAVLAIPSGKEPVKHTGAFVRINAMWSALQSGDWKKACAALEWYTLNQGATGPQCQQIMEAQFAGTHLQYRMAGESRGAAKYSVVTVITALDNPATKLNESAECVKAWADGKDCKWSGVYTFGTALQPSPADAFNEKKGVPLHWYVMWVD